MNRADLPLVIVVGADASPARAAHEIADVIHPRADVVTIRNPQAPFVVDPNRPIAVVVVFADGQNVDDSIARIEEKGLLDRTDTRVVVVTNADRHDDMVETIDIGRLSAIISHPTPGIIGWMVAWEVRIWLEDNLELKLTLPAEPNAPAGRGALLKILHAREEDLVDEFVKRVEEAIGPRTRLLLPEGTKLTERGREVSGMFLVLEGRVALTRQTRGESLLLHHASTGPLVGLLALTSGRTAYFTSTATQETVALHLSFAQLERAIKLAPDLAIVLAALSMRSLTARLMRSEDLQIERNALNLELDAERARLASALSDLEQARMELVSQARFATLGELSAGVAHELNNPVAAISGVSNHIPHDVKALIETHPASEVLHEIVKHASDSRSGISTALSRKARRAIEAATSDPEYAWGITASGVVDVDLAVRAHSTARDAALAAAGLAGTSHNIDVAMTRIGELVASLRSYSRPDTDVVADVDVNKTISDALHLLSNRTHDIEMVLDYGELPRISAHPSQLGQVWTNVVVNATDAVEEVGKIAISTTVDDGDVVVTVIDNGPGIPPDVLPRIFEPQFSTKKGTVRYGLGLGMGISRRIVEEHGGTMTAQSQPGRTEITVRLPIAHKEDA